MNEQLNIQLSQGSAATYLRWDGSIYSRIFRSSSLTATVKELLKSVRICQSYPPTYNSLLLFDPPGMYMLQCSVDKVILFRPEPVSPAPKFCPSLRHWDCSLKYYCPLIHSLSPFRATSLAAYCVSPVSKTRVIFIIRSPITYWIIYSHSITAKR